jgi:hypothetical protein
MSSSWIKSFLITPIVTWGISYTGYKIFGFTPNAYILSGIPSGFISAMLYYHLIPKAKFVVSTITYVALYINTLYFPATKASGDLQGVSHVHYIVFIAAAFFGILISFLINLEITRKIRTP